MADVTPKTIFEEELPKKLTAKPEIQKNINAVVVFDIAGANGGKWTIDLTKTSDWVKAGAEGVTPKMTVACSDNDFVSIFTKKLNAQMATVSGKMKLKPMDMGFAMKLLKLLD